MKGFIFEAYSSNSLPTDKAVIRSPRNLRDAAIAFFDDENRFLGYRAKDARNNYIIPRHRFFCFSPFAGSVKVEPGQKCPEEFLPYLCEQEGEGLEIAPASW